MSDTINNDYWLRRWKEGETGWHQDAPEDALIRYFGDLAPTRVLVPLCGKSLDLAWLSSRGHDVFGVELSEFAVEAFFREQGLKYERRSAGPYQSYEAIGTKITILQGDFFKLRPADIAPFGALYDRAALIALTPDLRARYVSLIKELIRGASASVIFLQLVLERIPTDDMGPPFSITEKMIRSYYEDTFTIEPLEREDAELAQGKGDQCVYRLRLK